jgi:hypothetical protein
LVAITLTVFVAAIPVVIYQDHKDLVSTNDKLVQENTKLKHTLSSSEAETSQSLLTKSPRQLTSGEGLTDVQATILDARMANYTQKGHIDDFYYAIGDLQSKIIRDRIADVLRRYSWKLPPQDSGGLAGAEFYGVRMYLNYGSKIPQYYGELKDALTATGLDVDAKEFKHPEYKPGEANLRIDVGHEKP